MKGSDTPRNDLSWTIMASAESQTASSWILHRLLLHLVDNAVVPSLGASRDQQRIWLAGHQFNGQNKGAFDMSATHTKVIQKPRFANVLLDM